MTTFGSADSAAARAVELAARVATGAPAPTSSPTARGHVDNATRAEADGGIGDETAAVDELVRTVSELAAQVHDLVTAQERTNAAQGSLNRQLNALREKVARLDATAPV